MDEFVSSLTTEPTTLPADPPAGDPPPADPPAGDPPPADPPAEPTTPTDGDDIPEAPKNRKDWDTLRGSRDRWKQTADEVQQTVAVKDQTIATLSQQLEEEKARAARVAELEEKLKDFDAYEKELAVTRLEATREFRETIAKPLQVIGTQATTIAQTNESDPEKVLDMLREADPAKQRAAFKEITTGWDEVDRSELWSMAKDARVLLDKQDMMRENASAAAKEQAEIAAKREAAEKEAFQKEYSTSAKDATKSLREKTPFVPLSEGETEDDRYLALEQKVLSVDFDSQTPRGKAFAAAAAILHPKMIQTIEKLQAENAAQAARIKELNSKGASVAPTEQNRPPAEGPTDFLSAVGVKQSPMLSHSLNVVGD